MLWVDVTVAVMAPIGMMKLIALDLSSYIEFLIGSICALCDGSLRRLPNKHSPLTKGLRKETNQLHVLIKDFFEHIRNFRHFHDYFISCGIIAWLALLSTTIYQRIEAIKSNAKLASILHAPADNYSPLSLTAIQAKTITKTRQLSTFSLCRQCSPRLWRRRAKVFCRCSALSRSQ